MTSKTEITEEPGDHRAALLGSKVEILQQKCHASSTKATILRLKLKYVLTNRFIFVFKTKVLFVAENSEQYLHLHRCLIQSWMETRGA